MSTIYIPGTLGDPGTPTTFTETNQTGWGSGSVSIPIIPDVGGYEFTVPLTVTGVICGIASNYVGSGYLSINHGLYFSDGVVRVVERGNQVANLGTWSSSDKWVIWKDGPSVTIYKNGAPAVLRTANFNSSFRLAATLYAKSDTVVNAKVASMQAAFGTVSGQVATLGAVCEDLLVNGVRARVARLRVAAAGEDTAAVRGRVATLGALSADYDYGFVRGQVAQVGAYAETGGFQPSWGVVAGLAARVTGNLTSLTGGLGDVAVEAGALRTLSANYAYGFVKGRVARVQAFGAQAVDITFALARAPTPYRSAILIVPSEVTGVFAVAPTPVPGIRFGIRFALRAPRAAAGVTLTIPRIMRVEGVAPPPTAILHGLTGRSASVLAQPAGRYGFGWRVGSRFRFIAPMATSSAAGQRGATLHVRVVAPKHYVVHMVATSRELVAWALAAPMPVMVPSFRIGAIAPMPVAWATLAELVDAAREGYSINLATSGVTHYPDYPFDNILRFKDRFFGVKADGVYELTGDTDDGAEILAAIKTFESDFGSANLKRVPWV